MKDSTKEVENIAEGLAWIERNKSGKEIDISCLAMGKARILHLPGELSEYQLSAKAMRPDLFVVMAAYGDCGPGISVLQLLMNRAAMYLLLQMVHLNQKEYLWQP